MLSLVLLVLLAGIVCVAVYRLNHKRGSAVSGMGSTNSEQMPASDDEPAPAPFAALPKTRGQKAVQRSAPLDLAPHRVQPDLLTGDPVIGDLGRHRSQRKRPVAPGKPARDIALPAGELARPGRPMGFDATREALICIYPSGAPRPAIEVRKTARGGSLVLADGKLLARLTTRDVTPGDIILCESARTCDEPLKKIA